MASFDGRNQKLRTPLLGWVLNWRRKMDTLAGKDSRYILFHTCRHDLQGPTHRAMPSD
jgi:hypothetical protein